MPQEFIFRGSLVQYWKLIYAEWHRSFGSDTHARNPLRMSHTLKDHPPREFEEVVLEFLDEQFRLGVVTVNAESVSDGKLVRLIVHIEREAYEESGKSALSRWNKIKSAWQRNGWLMDPLAQYQATNKRGMNSETIFKLRQVRELRWEYIKNKRELPTKAYIMSMAEISYATCKTHDPELLKNWKDTNYE